jgi:hypothetical protein
VVFKVWFRFDFLPKFSECQFSNTEYYRLKIEYLAVYLSRKSFGPKQHGNHQKSELSGSDYYIFKGRKFSPTY